MKKKTHKIINLILILTIIAGIVIPVLFTAERMGFFSREPQVDIEAEYTDENAPVLKIATDYDFCPNSYINKEGNLSGLYIEVMTEAANRLGVKPVFETSTWMGCRKMLEDGDVDVLLGLEIFSNMEGTLRTIPVCSDELCVYGKHKIDSAAALAGKKVALMTRSVIASTYDLQCEYLEYSTNTEILETVEKGEADYGICHGAVATKIIEKNGFHLVTGLSISKSYPALAVKDTQAQLRDQLNDALQEMSLDGTIGRLENKWITEFTRNTSLTYVVQHNLAFYITFAVAVIIFLVIIIAFRIAYDYQDKYIRTLLEYQEKLKQSNEETKRANRAKSDFLSHMSHDIRTPINGIMGMTEIMKKSLNDPAKLEECLDKIDMASNHLLSLNSDILDMSKISSEGINLEEVPIDLDEEIEKIHAMVDVQARDKQLDFRIHMKNIEHRYLLGSPVHLRRIILNLISNALRYNRPGGSIDFYVSERNSNGEYIFLELKVEDTGIGMSQEFLEKSLYKPFTQEDDSVRTEYHGTGLGMSIVKELIASMKGSIQAESQPGVGTVFTVTLPLKLNRDMSEKNITVKKDPDISGMKILVAEDNQLNMEIVLFMLESAGASVTAVQNGQEAVEKFESSAEGTYDLILLDIMMPVMDGLKAAEKIRTLTREDAKSIPIIAMTANAFEEDRRKTKEAGMNGHLTKPINSDKLLELLSQYKK